MTSNRGAAEVPPRQQVLTIRYSCISIETWVRLTRQEVSGFIRKRRGDDETPLHPKTLIERFRSL